MYKKILAAITALTLACSFAACGGGSTSTETSSATTQQTTPIQTEETAPTQTTAPQFEALTLVDDENCTVTIKGTDADSLFGYGVNLFLENKTDKELMFTVENVSVNGYMCDPFWAVTVAAGKKANEQMTFMESDFEANGITDVTDITFTLQVYDSNDWTADYLVEQTFTVNP